MNRNTILRLIIFFNIKHLVLFTIILFILTINNIIAQCPNRNNFSVSASPNSVCQGTTIQLSSNPGGSVNSYQWIDLSNSQDAPYLSNNQAQNPVVQATAPVGTYNYRLGVQYTDQAELIQNWKTCYINTPRL